MKPHSLQYYHYSIVFRKLEDSEIYEYVSTGLPLDKAGGYAIQNEVFQPVERVEGCYTSVVGLPLCALSKILFRKGVLKKITFCGDQMDAKAVTLR